MVKVPKIEDLVSANQFIKRRLFPEFKGEKFYLLNGRGERIEAKPYGFPIAILVSDKENPHDDPRNNDRPYLVGLHEENINVSFVNKREATIMLGVDYAGGDLTTTEIQGMLHACHSGPGNAQAYFLGGDHSFGELAYPWKIIPVQYFQISKKEKDSLALTDKEILKLRENIGI